MYLHVCVSVVYIQGGIRRGTGRHVRVTEYTDKSWALKWPILFWYAMISSPSLMTLCVHVEWLLCALCCTGEYPIVRPGSTFSYISCTHFCTTRGTMHGVYTMRNLATGKLTLTLYGYSMAVGSFLCRDCDLNFLICNSVLIMCQYFLCHIFCVCTLSLPALDIGFILFHWQPCHGCHFPDVDQSGWNLVRISCCMECTCSSVWPCPTWCIQVSYRIFMSNQKRGTTRKQRTE